MSQVAYGLAGVAVTQTRLSRVDGEAGRLTLAGFPVEELAPRASFEQVLFLLFNDRLPSPAEHAELRATLAEMRLLPEASLAALRAAASTGVEPMDALRIGMATVGIDALDLHRTELHAQAGALTQRSALRIVAALPTLVAAYHRLSVGEEPIAPDPALDHAESFLHGLRGERPSAAQARALTTYLNTTTDHGMNASTFTARVIASTRSCLSAAVLGALGALEGPLHGGAPGPALDMVFELDHAARESGRPLEAVAETWVRDRVEKGERIMGFGHRVYRVRDPRADVLGAAVERLFEASPGSSPAAQLYARARSVESVVLRVLAELKPGRVLQTNVEFYTALLLHGLDLSTRLFTPTFAVARVAGWTAHVLEQVAEDHLIRPSVVYVGADDRRWPTAA